MQNQTGECAPAGALAPASALSTSDLSLTAELAALPAMTNAQLRQRWLHVTGRTAPQLGSMLLRRALAWELQAKLYGGLSKRSERRLVQNANAPVEHRLANGHTLVREWKGVLHTVVVDKNETVHWNGKTWNSLSEVARAITGTRWSGPRFFGISQKAAAA